MLDCSELWGGRIEQLSCFQVGCYCGHPLRVMFHHTSFFFCFARLVLFVIATCTLTLTYFGGLLKKILLLRHAPLTLLGMGSSRRSSEETVLGEPFPRYVIDTRISTQTAFVCDYGFAFPTVAPRC